MEEERTVASTETPTTVADTEYTLTLADTDGEPGGIPIHSEIEGEGLPLYDAYWSYEEGDHLRWKDLEIGEEMEESTEGEKETQAEKVEEVEEEEQFVEEPPPDPAAPYNFSDLAEAQKDPYELRPDQVMECEMLWTVYQDYTPAYTDLDNYITEKELVYMLKALLLIPYTPEQLQELIEFCVRPPHPEGHINYEQFLKMVTLRQRSLETEEELRAAFAVYDPDNSGLVDRENLKEMLLKQGHKLTQKLLDNLMEEIDLLNDGTIGIQDAVGTMCIDLNREDIDMLKETLNPSPAKPVEDDDI